MKEIFLRFLLLKGRNIAFMTDLILLPYTVYALLIFCVCIKCLLPQHKTLLPLIYRVFMRRTVPKAFSIVGSLEVFLLDCLLRL